MSESRYIDAVSHMLDECGLTGRSYYDVYMLEHPSEKKPVLFEKLISEFANAVKKNGFDFRKCIGPTGRVVINRSINTVTSAASKMNFHYVWDRIRPDVYRAILSRAAHPEMSTGVSRKTICRCLDIICRNTNVLDANSSIGIWAADDDWNAVETLFGKYSLPKLPTDYYGLKEDSYAAVCETYSYWAAFQVGEGDAICNSDDGPHELRQILSECGYDADDSVLISTLNRCLDVTHVRGDLALAFIEGGTKTLDTASHLGADELYESFSR